MLSSLNLEGKPYPIQAHMVFLKEMLIGHSKINPQLSYVNHNVIDLDMILGLCQYSCEFWYIITQFSVMQINNIFDFGFALYFEDASVLKNFGNSVFGCKCSLN